MTDTVEIAYEIDRALDHFGPDDENDGELIRGQFPPEKEKNGISGLLKVYIPAPLTNVPNPLRFAASEFNLESTDYPDFEVPWPIISKRMLAVLKSVGDFAHCSYPVETDDVDCFPELNWQRSGIKNHNYILLHLTEHQDALDWDNSICERDPDLPHRVEIHTLKKLVIKIPEGGLPPIFRLSPMRTYLFVSSAAKMALEAAGIQGVRYTPASEVKY
jgi:hypothetical protein